MNLAVVLQRYIHLQKAADEIDVTQVNLEKCRGYLSVSATGLVCVSNNLGQRLER